jgi:LETM1 and EF-hand domain-containing protein 1, mitochondrial
VADLFRLIPFSMFLLIPLAEFALPFALKIFPNLLPSTFQDSLKAEENMKRELQSRLAMAQFFQETLEELAKEQKRKARKARKDSSVVPTSATTTSDSSSSSSSSDSSSSSSSSLLHLQEDSAASMLDFLQKARNGEMLESSVIIRYAKYFQDDLTLDNMPRMQLMNMCKYMNIAPYGNDSFLRFQLRHRIRILKEDDQRILWEGIESLTKMELREACQERGMRSTGLSKDAYKYALQQWLDLSVQKNVSYVRGSRERRSSQSLLFSEFLTNSFFLLNLLSGAHFTPHYEPFLLFARRYFPSTRQQHCGDDRGSCSLDSNHHRGV